MFVSCPHLSPFPHIRHAFFEYYPEPLSKFKLRAMPLMTGKSIPLASLSQKHGTTVITATNEGNEPDADGLVTNRKGLALGIITGDCGPILMVDPEAEVIGACHAGWRGAKAGIISSTIQAMEALGAKRENITATLGPTIQMQNYEVGPEFPDLIGEQYEIFFKRAPKENHHLFDLPRYVLFKLDQENLKKINDVGVDTFSNNYASRRRYLAEGIEKILIHNLSAIAIV